MKDLTYWLEVVAVGGLAPVVCRAVGEVGGASIDQATAAGPAARSHSWRGEESEPFASPGVTDRADLKVGPYVVRWPSDATVAAGQVQATSLPGPGADGKAGQPAQGGAP